MPVRHLKQKVDNNAVPDPNKPLDYFGSEAEKLRAGPVKPEGPKYASEITSVSLMIFLLYFCWFREENDIDEGLSRGLYDHFGEEGTRLKKAYDYNVEHGLPTAEILDRLREIGAPVPPRAK